MQMYVIAGVSDKIASQVVRQAAISTLVFGIVIGNYEFSGTFSLPAWKMPSSQIRLMGITSCTE